MEAQLSKGEILNYKIVEEDKEEAKIELDRYHQAGYTRYYSENEVKEHFSAGTISRLGLIVKVKESGVKKRRIILDLRRSGGNATATLPEKLVLPRPRDAIEMFRNLHGRERGSGDMELVVIDISDAFMALPVPTGAPAYTGTSIGERPIHCFRGIVVRVQGCPAFVEQGGEPHEQTTADDSLWALTGALEERNHTPSYCTAWQQ